MILTRLVLTLAALFCFAPPTHATTWYVKAGANPSTTGPATSCERADVQTAHNFASVLAGDTIMVGPGTCAYSSNVVIGDTNKHLTILGADPATFPLKGAPLSGGTTITVEANAFGIYEASGGPTILAGFRFVYPSTTTSGLYIISIQGPRVSGGRTIFHHNTYTLEKSPNGGNVFIDATSRSIHYRNIASDSAPSGVDIANATNNSSFLDCSVAQEHPPSWATASTIGTADTNGDNNVYIEDSELSYMWEGIDVTSGCRMVMRHNILTTFVVTGHGRDSGFGSRHLELVNNHFKCGAGLHKLQGYVTPRGGTGVFKGNTFDLLDTTSCAFWVGSSGASIGFSIYRLQQYTNGGWAPSYADTYPVPRQIGWGYTTGATLTTGDGSKWATVACNPTYTTSVGNCGANHGITRSGATATFTTVTQHNLLTGESVTIQGATQAEYNGTFTITKVNDYTFTYSVAGTPATPAGYNPAITMKQSVRGESFGDGLIFKQDLEPWYIYDNTNNSGGALASCCIGGIGDLGLFTGGGTDFFQQNREYYLRAPQGGDPVMTSYTMYTYPHPLANVTGSASTPTTFGPGVRIGPGVTVR